MIIIEIIYGTILFFISSIIGFVLTLLHVGGYKNFEIFIAGFSFGIVVTVVLFYCIWFIMR